MVIKHESTLHITYYRVELITVVKLQLHLCMIIYFIAYIVTLKVAKIIKNTEYLDVLVQQ